MKKKREREASRARDGRKRRKEDESFGRRQIREKARKRVARRFFLRIRNRRAAVFVLPFPFPPFFFSSFHSFSFFSFISPPLLLRCNLAATRRLQLPTAVACLTSSPLRFLAFSLGLSALLRDVYFSTLVRDRSFRRRVTRVARNFNTLEGSERASRQAG